MAIHLSDDDSELMSEINVTPLVDVMLVLVVVFLVTAPLLTQTIPVNLPKAAQTSAPAPSDPVNLGISADGSLRYNDEAVGDIAALESRMKTAISQDAETAFVVHADQSVQYQHVARLLASAHRSGVHRLSLATLAE